MGYSRVSVSGQTTSSFATNLATKKNSNLIVYQSWGDAHQNVARIGVTINNVNDASCAALPSSGYMPYKNIFFRNRYHTFIETSLVLFNESWCAYVVVCVLQ